MEVYDKICKCGCGQKIEIKAHHKYQGIPNYLLGHARRRLDRPYILYKEPNLSYLCACGCGKIIVWKEHHSRYGIPKYVHGHNQTGKELSIEHKRKIGEANTGISKGRR